MFHENLLKSEMAKKGVNVDTLSKVIGITNPTFYRKLGRNGDFSRKEMEGIKFFLGLDAITADHIFFG